MPGRAVRRPRGRLAALVRTFKQDPAPTPRPAEHRRAVGRGLRRRGAPARRPTAPRAGWYAGCTSPRVQLLSTHEVKGVGDEAMLFVAARLERAGAGPGRRRRPHRRRHDHDLDHPSRRRGPGPGTERGAARQRRRRPLRPARRRRLRRRARSSRPCRRCRPAPAPALLSEVDLPPVTEGDPAVGRHRAGASATTNLAATRCDETDFSAGGVSSNLTRSFLIPGAELPPEFGLTETVGALPAKQARGVRRRRPRGSSRPARTATSAPRSTRSHDVERGRPRPDRVAGHRRGLRRAHRQLPDGRSSATAPPSPSSTFVPADGVVMGGEPFVALADARPGPARPMPAQPKALSASEKSRPRVQP